MGAGRTGKYQTHVLPRFDEIKEWLELGATQKEICDQLGVNEKVFCKYKNEHKELNDLCQNSRRRPIQQIKAALMKRATGFYYTETTTVTSDKGIQTTTYNRYCIPDVSAASLLLKHWDKNEDGSAIWSNDPATLEIKKQELEIKKEHMESEGW